MGLVSVIVMSALLGLGAFGIGNLPLFFTFSRSRIQYLSTLGTGLLLGASLGVVIPEGIETITKDSPNGEVPTSTIALCLLSGFAFMMIVEQFLSGHEHGHEHNSPPTDDGTLAPLYENGASPDTSLENAPKPVAGDDYEMQLENLDRGGTDGWVEGGSEEYKAAAKTKAYPLTLGLVIHSLADGLALGASALPLNGSEGADGAGASSTGLSIIVFFALMIHKAPTALALSMSLISSSLPRYECRKHIAFFSVSTPIGALVSYVILSTIGTRGSWTGISLLISGGTFLYVATVLQPLSHSEESSPSHAAALPSANMGEKTRALLVILGMFIPFLIGIFVGDDH
ncbi:Zinc/iron permease [Schizopora paradoxa]|uniref:Zinc/iron permease n=1 Tax=Schizopora paradoxa TaxID=27342 RepID=A0A0H2RIK0_9AGAM|nr:Zinc/iron permease [Schizopora paradoxa]